MTKDKIICLPKSVFTFSFDTELVWGMYRNYPEFLKLKDDLWFTKRKNIKFMLKEFDRYNIPATWAVVGHLFLDKCDGKHVDVKKGDNWIQSDPGTNIKKAPLWYGKDIIDLIINAKAEHEIASHGFSHLDIDKCKPEVADSEIKKCRKLFRDLPVKLTTFIFPRDRYGNFNVLKKNKIKIYRKEVNTFRDNIKNKTITKVVRALDILLFIKADPLEPIMENNGLVRMPKSRLIIPINNATVSISSKLALSLFRFFNFLKIKRTINKAIRKKLPIHLYSHPIDFIDKSDIIYLGRILKYVKMNEKAGKIECLTMQQIYNKYLR